MNTGQIVKSKQSGNYTVVPNEYLQNPELSMQAKGLLTYLLSLPHDWVLHKTELSKHFKNGADSIRTAFAELEESGFILSTKILGEKGQFSGYNYVVYEKSVLETPISENPKSDMAESENPTLLSTNTNKVLIVPSTKKEEFLGEIRTDFTSYMTSWNDFARKNRLVAVARITDKRRKKLESRLKEPMFDFERILNIASEQKFLLGENERKWKVEFDWLIENDNNYVKVLEKKYLKSTSTYQSTIPKEQNKWM